MSRSCPPARPGDFISWRLFSWPPRPILLQTGIILACLLAADALSPSSVVAQGKKRNQLGDLFRQLDRGIREGAEEIKNSKSVRDQLDIRPVQRPEDNRRLQQARDLIEQKKWNDAVEVLQFLLEQPNDAFSLSDAHEFRSLQTEVDRLIENLPPEGLRNYENRYGVMAQQKLEAGLTRQDDALLIEVSAHYFHTAAGRRAMALLARKWKDQGDFGRSAEAWLQLFHSATDRERASSGRMAARMLALAGRSAKAAEIAKSLPDADNLQRELQQLQSPAASPRDHRGPYFQFSGTDHSTKHVEPSLLPRWSVSLVERYNAAHQINLLKAELRELGRTFIPTLQPLTVQGKVAFRTLRSLQVRDLSTGGLIWERRMPHSPEELLTSGAGHEPGAAEYRFSSDSMVEQHPLASLLFRDQVYGSLSSDGMKLFAVESTGEAALSAPLHLWQLQMEGAAAKTPWDTNELTAYDLKTGRICWRVGGIAIEKEFSRPLAGTRFLSAPTPDGPEMYVLGERDGEILLFCLATQSGEQLWEQPLAAPGRPIREDLVRGQWVCQPVLADGLILCPTTCGWMIAVDQTSHRLKWSTRFAPRLAQQERFRSGYSSQPLQELNRRWQAVVTVVSNGKVLVTPPELPDEFGMIQPMIYCLDEQTGKILWEQPKSERSGGMALYLGGVWQGQAVIVGSSHVIGRSLENSGEILWSVALPERPTGRGIIVQDSMLLPVVGTKLLKIDLKSSTIEKTFLPAIDGELGNLELHRGHVISTSYLSAAALPADVHSLQTEIDPDVLARVGLGESKLLLAEKQFEQLELKLEAILKIPELPPELRMEVLQVQRSGLQERLQSLPPDADTLLAHLEQLSQTPEERRDFLRIRADYWLHSGNHQKARTAYFELLEQFPATEFIDDGSLTLRIDSWVHGRLRQLYEAAAEPAARNEFQQTLNARVQKLQEEHANFKTKDRWARALAFDKSGLQLELDLAEEEFQRGATAAGLMRLCRVSEAENTILRTPALIRLAQRLADQGWHQDALTVWEELSEKPGQSSPDHQKVAELAAAGLAAARQALQEQNAAQSNWGDCWALERVGVTGNERNFETLTIGGNGFRAVAGLRLIQEADNNRIRLEDERTGHSLTSFPLRSSASLEYHPSIGARLLASTLYIVHGGILHALAWPDQEMLWSWNSDVHGVALSRMALVQPTSNFSLQSVQQFAAARQLYAYRSQSGYLQAATPRALLVHCKDWIALDPLTGEELWRDRAAPERGSAQPLGADWLILSSRANHQVRNAISGLPRSNRTPDESTSRPIVIDGKDFILLNRNLRAAGKHFVHGLRRITPSGEAEWDMEIPSDALLGLPDTRSLVVLQKSMEMSVIDLQNGRAVSFGKIAESAPAAFDTRNAVSVISDEDRFYVFINDGNVRPVYVNLPAVRLAGTILAFSREGERLWQYRSPAIKLPRADTKAAATSSNPWALNVLIQNFQESPLLLLVGDDDRQDPNVQLRFHQIRVIGLDKATGEPRIDWERPSESGGFSYLYFDVREKAIDLRTYNERLQLTSKSSSSTPGSAP